MMNIVGKTVKAVRPMTHAELQTEGNGPGVFFGITSDGQAVMLGPIADLEAA